VAHEDRHEAEALTNQLAASAALTRSRVAGDIEALGAKLAPENIKTEAKLALLRSIARQLTRLGRAVPAITRGARRHPIPVALTLLGLGVVVWRVRRA
jgi:hypothetical protein